MKFISGEEREIDSLLGKPEVKRISKENFTLKYIRVKQIITNFDPSSSTSMLLWLGLLSTSMSLSYFLVIVPAEGVDSRDSSRLVAEPVVSPQSKKPK